MHMITQIKTQIPAAGVRDPSPHASASAVAKEMHTRRTAAWAIQSKSRVQFSVPACEKSFATFARLPWHLEPSVAAADLETEVLRTYGKMCPNLCATP